jgi:hypothetical protein
MEQTTEQIVACLLAEIRTNRDETRTNQERLEAKIEAKADATLRETEAEIRTNQGMMEISQEEMKAKMDAHHERIEANMDAWLEEMKAWRRQTTACLEGQRPIWRGRSQPQKKQGP